MKMQNVLFTGLFVIIMAGCSTTYVPAPGTPDVKQIGEFPQGTRVALVNAQRSTNLVVLSQQKQNTYYADLHAWTDRLVISLRDTLKKKKVVVDEQAPKTLKISIKKAAVKPKAGGFAAQCDLEWRVETSDGKILPMSLQEGHWKVEDASNVAVRRACLLTLSNDVVRRFLSTP